MNPLLEIEALVLGVLLLASLVGIAVRRVRIPYTLGLVLAGLALALRSEIQVELTSELILSLFLPPLIFEAALHINLAELRRNFLSIAVLAVPGVVLTMGLVAGVMALGAGVPLPIGLVFGSLIAATDPAAVIAIFRKSGVPKRLEVLLEGESLLNDGTAIVLHRLALLALVTGSFPILVGVGDFLRVVAVGVVIGLGLGWITSRLIAQIDDYLIETTLTTVLAFGAYLVAEELQGSGVLAVLAAGLVNGNLGPRGMSPTTRIVVLNFWEYVAFLANSAVFLLIGLQSDLPALSAHLRPIAWGILAVLVSRAVSVYGLSRLTGPIPISWRHVLFWGGLRGGVALALALGLPAEMGPARDSILAMALGVTLFTLLGQGLSMDWILRRLGFLARSEDEAEYERRHARAQAASAGLAHLQAMREEGLVSEHAWDQLRPVLHERQQALADAVRQLLKKAPDVEAAELGQAAHEVLRAQRVEISRLRRLGVMDDATHAELIAEVDLALGLGSDLWSRQLRLDRPPAAIRHLLTVLVSDRDAESAVNALTISGIPTTRLAAPSESPEGDREILLVGLPEGRLEFAVGTLRKICRRRVEFLPTPSASLSAAQPPSTSVSVGGALVYLIEVERYEEILL